MELECEVPQVTTLCSDVVVHMYSFTDYLLLFDIKNVYRSEEAFSLGQYGLLLERRERGGGGEQRE